MIGLAAARRGDNLQAISSLGQVIDSGLVDPVSRPDVFATLGRAYAESGEPRKAAELFEYGLELTKRDAPGDVVAQVRYATYLSFALTDLGDLERARTVVQDALECGQETDDSYTRVRLYWSLGRIAHEQARPVAALDHFRRALSLLELTEDTLHLARAHLSVAGSAILTGELIDAGGNLEVAERLLGRRPEPGDLAELRRMQADLAVANGDGAEAVRRGREAAEASGTTSPNKRGLALAAIAAGLALQDDPEADDVYREAVELLASHGTRRERSEVLRAYGRYLRSVGRDHEAFEVLDRAAEIAATLHPAAPVTVDA
jgi:tetratricopeptide (TPR) repeat protein